MQDDLNKYKQFESQLKAYLIQEFGKFLPEDKISLLNNTDYVTKNYNKDLSEEENHGKITRGMLKDVINIECSKIIEVEEGVSLPIQYGKNLETALIEYYAQNLSQKYGFNINEIPELKNDLETIKLLNQKLDSTFDPTVFNSDAVKLLDTANIKELIEKYDSDAIKEYFEKNKKVSSQVGGTNKEEENELMKENSDRENSVQIVWLNGKKYIKYIDQKGTVSLTEIIDQGQTENFYKRKLTELKPGEKLDPEKFKHELSEIMGDITLTETSDVDKDNLNHKEINMLNFINANDEIKKQAQKDIITHSNDMDIHVIESTNDIVVTEDKDYHVDAHMVKDGKAQAQRESLQDTKDISSRILTKEEYQELVNKYARGEELTLEELESLKRTSEYYIDQGETLEDVMQEKGSVLSPYKNTNYSGFGFSNFITILVCTGAICTLIMSIYLILFYK